MRDLIADLIPHAPQHGLFVAPDIPAQRLQNAIRDYARDVSPGEVLALYDATLLGTGKDGAIFLADRFIYQNHALQEAQEVRYEDLVQVDTKRKLVGGRRVLLGVNRGRATISLTLDFSGKPGAAEYVARFLNEAMLHVPSPAVERTDVEAVREALRALLEAGRLTRSDYERMLQAIGTQ